MGAASAPKDGLTIIGADIVVKGRVEGDEDLRIEGRVEGTIVLSQTLYVESGGIVVAQVQARDIVVSGIVVGNVQAENCITLHAGARLVGDLAAPRVVIEDGAAFKGSVAMGESAAGSAKNANVAKRPSRAPARTTTESRTVAKSPRGASKPKSESETRPKAKAEPVARPRVAPIRVAARDDDEVTVVVRHAEIATRSGKTAKKAAKKKAKNTPPRARMPKPGKRRISRR
ncbi:MAG: polymer-forming cytoskeletal protein [Nannocystaceae bacterium]|nr:polymer-forming cytoskeletal protein [Nannocystaceae bacterium]